MKVRLTPSARSRFLGAFSHIASGNRGAALELRRRAGEALAKLERFPEARRIVPEFPDLPFREVVLATYRFFCRAKDETVWIAAVWRSAQIAVEPGRESVATQHINPEAPGGGSLRQGPGAQVMHPPSARTPHRKGYRHVCD